MLSPMVIEVAFVSDYLQILRRLFPFWEYRAQYLVLSDILFFEGGLFLIIGALLAGVTLYNAWVPDAFKARFTESLFNWKIIRKGREISPALKIGLILIGAGIIYILAAIIVTL
jgi:hypothetical protein